MHRLSHSTERRQKTPSTRPHGIERFAQELGIPHRYCKGKLFYDWLIPLAGGVSPARLLANFWFGQFLSA